MVEKITEELLRRRAEHNNGELSSLREVTLHQFDIEKIENLDIYCRNLEILFLQNNQIGKIENLHKLKSLKYLNLALNNIRRIENLEACEALTKLDLTVNFVEDLSCIQSLRNNYNLRELHLTGNPCTKLEGYRLYVIATLPQLKVLDSIEIDRTERLLAQQEYPFIRNNIESQESTATTAKNAQHNQPEKVDLDDIDLEEKLPFTPEARLATARKLSKVREEKDKPKTLGGTDKPPSSIKAPLPNRNLYHQGTQRILQCNESQHEFSMSEEDGKGNMTLRVQLSKFLDSSLVDVNVQAEYVEVKTKGKLLRLVWPEPGVDPSQSSAQRSKLTGELLISAKRRQPQSEKDDFVEKMRLKSINKEKKANNDSMSDGNLKKGGGLVGTLSDEEHARLTPAGKLKKELAGCVNVHDIVAEKMAKWTPQSTLSSARKLGMNIGNSSIGSGSVVIEDKKHISNIETAVHDLSLDCSAKIDELDDADVPPLE